MASKPLKSCLRNPFRCACGKTVRAVAAIIPDNEHEDCNDSSISTVSSLTMTNNRGPSVKKAICPDCLKQQSMEVTEAEKQEEVAADNKSKNKDKNKRTEDIRPPNEIVVGSFHRSPSKESIAATTEEVIVKEISLESTPYVENNNLAVVALPTPLDNVSKLIDEPFGLSQGIYNEISDDSGSDHDMELIAALSINQSEEDMFGGSGDEASLNNSESVVSATACKENIGKVLSALSHAEEEDLETMEDGDTYGDDTMTDGDTETYDETTFATRRESESTTDSVEHYAPITNFFPSQDELSHYHLVQDDEKADIQSLLSSPSDEFTTATVGSGIGTIGSATVGWESIKSTTAIQGKRPDVVAEAEDDAEDDCDDDGEDSTMALKPLQQKTKAQDFCVDDAEDDCDDGGSTTALKPVQLTKAHTFASGLTVATHDSSKAIKGSSPSSRSSPRSVIHDKARSSSILHDEDSERTDDDEREDEAATEAYHRGGCAETSNPCEQVREGAPPANFDCQHMVSCQNHGHEGLPVIPSVIEISTDIGREKKHRDESNGLLKWLFVPLGMLDQLVDRKVVR